MSATAESIASTTPKTTKSAVETAHINEQTSSQKRSKVARVLPWILVIAGVLGLIGATVITYDKMQLLQNPAYKPSCNLNPIISCGSVMSSAQSHVFGFSNSFIGMAAFPVLITIGMAIFAGATFKKWFWRGLNIGAFLGVVFVHWLFFQSVYRIHALCPWCMLVWICTITTFVYSTTYNLEIGALTFGKATGKITEFMRQHHLDLLLFWLLIIAAFILKHFWYYYGKYL